MGIEVIKRKCSHFIKILKEMSSLPSLTVTISKENANIYQDFTKSHPRYKIIQNKKWGVAILPVPDIIDDYLGGRAKQALRTNRRKCLKKGYYFKGFSPKKYFQDIMDINLSFAYRCGKPMKDSYVNEVEVGKWLLDKKKLYGVFDGEDTLRAYAYVCNIGEVCMVSRLLGHAKFLGDGIMYLLFSEIVKDVIHKKVLLGNPKYIMYDTVLGASSGLRFFKERLGFLPFKVKWRLK